MQLVLLTAAGGAIGAVLRFLVNQAGLKWVGPAFPWWTVFVNVTGSLAMGLLAALLMQRTAPSDGLRAFLATGILGGYTTFSAFSLDFAGLLDRGEAGAAVLYAGGSVALSLMAVFLGLWLGRVLIAA
ncbi:MAG: fluoride efflux transporter CrcB [Hyphomicrobiaceae bacterium]